MSNFYCGLQSINNKEHIIYIKKFSEDSIVTVPGKNGTTGAKVFSAQEIAQLVKLLDKKFSYLTSERHLVVNFVNE